MLILVFKIQVNVSEVSQLELHHFFGTYQCFQWFFKAKNKNFNYPKKKKNGHNDL